LKQLRNFSIHLETAMPPSAVASTAGWPPPSDRFCYGGSSTNRFPPLIPGALWRRRRAFIRSRIRISFSSVWPRDEPFLRVISSPSPPHGAMGEDWKPGGRGAGGARSQQSPATPASCGGFVFTWPRGRNPG
jgi:hypothetical protein